MSDGESIYSRILPHLRQMPGYTPIEPPEVLAERLGLPLERIIKLLLPVDHVVAMKPEANAVVQQIGEGQPIPADKMALDIGPKTIELVRVEVAKRGTASTLALPEESIQASMLGFLDALSEASKREREALARWSRASVIPECGGIAARPRSYRGHMPAFKSGDLVHLRSGSPTMIVEAHHLRAVLQRRGEVQRLQGGHAAAAHVGERGLRPRV